MNREKCKQKLTSGGELTFTFVGDSLTYGLDHCTPDETYVAHFAERVGEILPSAALYRYDGIPAGELDPLAKYEKVQMRVGACGKIHVLRSGVGGNTVLRAMNRFGDYTGILPSGTRSDFIFTLFGVNDALYKDPRKYVTPDVFAQHYKELLHRLGESEPQAQIILITASTNDQCIDAHVGQTVSVARELGLPLIDLNSLWNAHFDPSADNFGHGDWLSGGPDATHFTPKSAKISADFIFDRFSEIIG